MVDLNSIDASQDVDFVPPVLLMNKEEMRTAKALLRAIDIRLGKERLLSDQKQKNYILKIEKLSSERRDLANSLESLCEVVLKRELGIERYMVLRVIRYSGYERCLQALQFSLMSGLAETYGLAWHIRGRSLRQNGTLGEKAEYASFVEARIERRRLDGKWVRLTLREANDESPAK